MRLDIGTGPMEEKRSLLSTLWMLFKGKAIADSS